MKLALDGTKIAWHLDRVKAWLRGERIAPIMLDMALTRRCNYNCIYCYSKLQENPRKLITWPIMDRFLDDAAEMGVRAIALMSDGESTMSPAFVPTVQRGASLGISMGLATNGYLVDATMAEAILPHLTYIRINISAADADEYARIHGTVRSAGFRVIENIRNMIRIKERGNLPVTIGMQMVLMPEFAKEVIPLTQMAIDLGVDYFIVKHCSDDMKGSLGIDYGAFEDVFPILEQAERLATEKTQVHIKWSKFKAGQTRTYRRCYATPFILQISGSGLVGACGELFAYHERYQIGNIVTQRFRDIIYGDRYWEVMNHLSSEKFDTRTMCGGYLCVQHNTNEWLDKWIKLGCPEIEPGEAPAHVNFV